MIKIVTPDTSPEDLRLIYSYDETTGEFRLIKGRGGRRAGTIAGWVNAGVRFISVDNQMRLAARVAWAHYYGEWPKTLIDHIDGDRLNNAIANLRLATFQQNMWNRAARKSSSGRKGVCWDKQKNLWVAQITQNRKHIFIGRFKTVEEASDAYEKVATELRGAWHRPNQVFGGN